MRQHSSSAVHPSLIALPRCPEDGGDTNGLYWGVSLPKVLVFGMCVLLLSACEAIQDSNAKNEEQVSVSGRVVGADGQGLLEVTIQVLWCRWPSGGFPVRPGLRSMSPRRQERHEFARTTTDATGAFAILLPAWFVKMKPEARLLASKENHGAAIEDFRNIESSVPRVIVLAGEERIEGSITDEFGHPVAGARVGMVTGGLEAARTYSDELGRFSIGRNVQVESWKCFVHASRSPNDIGVWAQRSESSIPLRMTLPRGSTKTVHVRDAANRPLKNERVIVTAASPVPLKRPFRMTEMLTDDDGVLVVEGIHDEKIYLSGSEGGALDPGPESVVVMKDLRQIPLEIVDDGTGIGLFEVVIYPSGSPGRCVFFGKDSWRSGNSVTFQIGRHDLSFVTDGYEPWSGVVSIDRDTQNLKIRLKEKM